MDEAVAAADAGRIDEALAGFDAVVTAVGDSDDPGLLRFVSTGVFLKGLGLAGGGRTDEAVAAFDEVQSRFWDSDDSALAWSVIPALYEKGIVLRDAAFAAEDAVATFGEVVAQHDRVSATFGMQDEASIVEPVANALGDQASLLLSLSDYAGAAIVAQDLHDRFSNFDDRLLDLALVRGRLNLALAHVHLGQIDEARAVFDEITLSYGESSDPDVRDVVDGAVWLGSPTGLTCTVFASILQHLRQRIEAIDLLTVPDFAGAAERLDLVQPRLEGNRSGLEALPSTDSDLDQAVVVAKVAVDNYVTGLGLVAQGARDNDLQTMQTGELILIEGDAALFPIMQMVGVVETCGL